MTTTAPTTTNDPSIDAAQAALVRERAADIGRVVANAERAGIVDPIVVIAAEDSEIGGKITRTAGRSPIVFLRSEELLLTELQSSEPAWLENFAAGLVAKRNPPAGSVRVVIFAHGHAAVSVATREGAVAPAHVVN